MMILSKLCSPFLRRLAGPPQSIYRAGTQPVRFGGAGKRVLRIFISRTQDNKFKKYFARYLALGAIPGALLIFYTSVVIGYAELYDYDPDLWEPEYWEFYPHPLTRFLAKYCMEDPKLSYYKHIYALEYDLAQLQAIALVNDVDMIERKLGRSRWHHGKSPVSTIYQRKLLDEYAEEHEIERYRKD